MRYRRKLLILYGVFLLGLLAIWLRVAQLSFVEGDTWEHRARMERTHGERLEAPRGEIVDARGRVLARDMPVFQLVLHAWSYERRLRARCTRCGIVHFYKNPKRPPRSCACQRVRLADPYSVQVALPPASEYLVALPPGDLAPLERALDLEVGALHERAQARIDEIDRMMEDLEERLLEEEIEEFLIDDRVEQRKHDMMRRPFPLDVDIPLEAVRLLQLDEVGTYRGFGVQTVLRRHYPQGDFAPQLLGSTSVVRDRKEYEELDAAWPDRHTMKSRIGRSGIERAYHSDLAGVPGYRRLELDADGQFSVIVEHEPPSRGRRLQLGIDLEMSRHAEKRIEHYATREKYWPRCQPSGAFVAMDADTHEILMWAELPRYDLNTDLNILYDPARTQARADREKGTWIAQRDLPEGMSREAWLDQLCMPAPRALSRVMDVAVEPGSTFKPLIALAFLRSPVPLPYSGHFTCHRDGRLPGCHNCGNVDLARSICKSCNKYYSYSLRDFKRQWPVYRRTVAQFIRSLRFGSDPIPELPGAAKGQWLRGYVDFRLADLLPRVAEEAGRELARPGEAAVAVQIVPRAGGGMPQTLGGDPSVLQRTLVDIVKQIVADTGTRRVGLTVVRTLQDGLASNYRFTLGPVGRAGWSRAPRRYDGHRPHTLPPALRRARNRVRFQLADSMSSSFEIDGAFAHGAEVSFTARFDNEVGRTRPDQPEWIRGEDGRNVAIGQGPVLVTPLQMVRAMATIANGGYIGTPHVVRKVGERVQRWSREKLPIDPAHLRLVREGMHGTVIDGTARNAGFGRVPARVYGKTGTAQVGPEWRPFGKGAEEGEPWHHWFVGFAEKPGHRRVAFACVLHARGEAAAGLTAARACADILETWYAGAPK